MSYAEQALETTIRQLRLPVDERKIRLGQGWEKLEAVESSHKNGPLHEMTKKLLQKTRKFTTDDLIHHLKSENGRNNVLKWKKSTLHDEQHQHFDERNVSKFLQDRITNEIAKLESYHSLCEWANNTFVEDAREAEKTLNILTLDVSGGNTSDRDISVNSATLNDDDDDDSDDISQSTKKLKLAAAVMATPLLLAAAPFALVIGVIATPLVALGKMIASVKQKSFKAKVAEAFDAFLTQCQTDDAENLHNLVLTLLEQHSLSVKFVTKDVPEQIKTTRQRLMALEEQDEVYIPKYKELLYKCQEKNGELSKFSLQIYSYRYTDNDLKWPQPTKSVGTCSFGAVHKVTLQFPEMKEAALKLMDDQITPQKALDFRRELHASRY